MTKFELDQLKDLALTPEQTEHCVGGSGGGKVLINDLEGF